MAEEAPQERYQFFSQELKQEQKTPYKTKIIGTIPKWLTGSLYRIGPGKFQVGPNKYKHWFDGLAVLHKFSFHQGTVHYQNKFLQSDAYLEALNKSYIAKTEFGTAVMADPCKSLYQKFMAWFDPSVSMTDNCLVNLYEGGGKLFVSTETPWCFTVNKENLDTEKKIRWDERIPINTATAHPQVDSDGTIYNVGTLFLYKSMYEFFKVLPEVEPDKEVRSESVGRLIASYPYPSYYHSFGMTENFFILVEQPLFVNAMKLGLSHVIGYSFEDTLYLDERKKTVIRVFSRKTGKDLITKYKYTADPLFLFHHINAFEDDDHIVFDVCAYDDPSVIKKLYFMSLQKEPCTDSKLPFIRRFVLPMKMDGKVSDDINKLSYSSAKAEIRIDGSVHCTPEIIHSHAFELPRINPEYNGKKYRYVYGIGGDLFNNESMLKKVNVADGTSLTWQEDHCFPSEPIFIPHPDAEREDDGIVVSLVIKVGDEPYSFMLVLDATNFTELGRALVDEQLPATIHGLYLR
ncbi:Beta,beta-carotene 15,15'-dioxygenase [Holothuria leucospilota]|uniref:Beta,beta-carotene 15,15'-dioxygenase n=1 Tax=Holothuria leucospilota TaxID=206669 RepID=A0A9Q0YGD6_HOLLE|nr:Beta,beta-carotene 15,15'-dioxygenase [Holothuria leucospilota]